MSCAFWLFGLTAFFLCLLIAYSVGHYNGFKEGDIRLKVFSKPDGEVYKVLIRFPVGIEIDDRAHQTIVEMITRLCDIYEKEHPEEVMWMFGMGGDEGAAIYSVNVREDYYGENPNNPNEAALKAQLQKLRDARDSS